MLDCMKHKLESRLLGEMSITTDMQVTPPYDRNQIANIHWIIEKAREFQEHIYFHFTDYTKA